MSGHNVTWTVSKDRLRKWTWKVFCLRNVQQAVFYAILKSWSYDFNIVHIYIWFWYFYCYSIYILVQLTYILVHIYFVVVVVIYDLESPISNTMLKFHDTWIKFIVTSVIPVRWSTNWAIKPHIGSEVNLLSSCLPWGLSEMMWSI